MRTAAVCTFLHLFRLFPAGGKIGNRVNNRRGGVPAPDDADGFYNFVRNPHFRNTLDGAGTELLRGQDGDAQTALDHVGWNKNGVAQQFDITVPGSIHHSSAFGTIAGLENANYGTKFGTVFKTAEGEPYSPCWADVAKAYGVDAVRVESAEEFLPAMKKAVEMNKAGKPYLVEAPMENIVVPTPGCWNINDIYSPNQYVSEGKLVEKEDGKWVAPNHAKSHKAK